MRGSPKDDGGEARARGERLRRSSAAHLETARALEERAWESRLTLAAHESFLRHRGSARSCLLAAMLDTAIAACRADGGSVRLVDPLGHVIEAFDRLTQPTVTPAELFAALQSASVVIDDVTANCTFDRETMERLLDANVRAMISTVIHEPGGEEIGALSVFYAQPLDGRGLRVHRIECLARVGGRLLAAAARDAEAP